jgi:hypothetical protein
LLHGDAEIEIGPEALVIGAAVKAGDEVVQLHPSGPEGWPLDL